MSEQAASYTTCQEPHSSIELSQTAKGLTQVSVKVYAHEPDMAADEAQRIYDELIRKYGRGGDG